MLAAGARLGPYEILAPAGAGGMGEVYSAKDTRLDRTVAVKILPGGLQDRPEWRRRLEREARAISRLNHPRICTLHDIGEHEGKAFLVMEYVEGETLAERLEKGPLPVESALRYGIEIAEALDAAHRQGVIHRDLKPANVKLGRDGLKLLDFGLAKFEAPGAYDERQPTRSLGLTAEGAVLGTVPYMAPEQVEGKASDPRTDIFALGVVLYEMVTGRRPFAGTNPASLIAAILTSHPPSLASLQPMSPPALQRLVERCLAKAPDERWQTARDLLAELRWVLEGLEQGTVAAAASPTPERAVVPAARERPSIAVLPFVDMSSRGDQEYFCDGMAEEIINALARIEDFRVVARTSAFQYKGKGFDVRQIGKDLNVQSVLEGSVRTASGRLRVSVQLVSTADGCHLWSDRYDRDAQDVFAIQDEIARSVSEVLRVKLVTPIERHTESLEAYHLYLKGQHYWHLRGGLEKALAYFGRAIEVDAAYAPAHAGLAISYAILGIYGFFPPAFAFSRAKIAVDRALEINDLLAEAHAGRAWIWFWFDWDWDRWESHILRALALNPGYVDAYCWHAFSLGCMGRYEDAQVQIRRALELDPLSHYVHSVRGLICRLMRQPAEAIAQLRQTVAANPATITGRTYLGLSYLQHSMYDEAIAELEEVAARSARAPALLGYLALAYGTAGRFDAVNAVVAELQRVAAHRYVSPLSLAFAWIGLGDFDRAFGSLDEALAERVSLLATAKVEPLFDPLRSDPRFDGLLRRLKLAD